MNTQTEGTITAWMPEQDQHRLACLGKLIEECNELAARAARCIIQGIDATDPASGRTNREELAREMADVEACMHQAEKRLDVKWQAKRAIEKSAGFNRWHDLIDGENAKAVQP